MKGEKFFLVMVDFDCVNGFKLIVLCLVLCKMKVYGIKLCE